MTMTSRVHALMLAAALALPAAARANDDGGYTNAVYWAECQVVEVATFANRVHVKCSTTLAGEYIPLRYFASPTSNSAEAARLLAMGTAALTGAGGGKLWVLLDLSKSDAVSYGCAWNDCRRPLETRLVK